jgi:hypothetical protein
MACPYCGARNESKEFVCVDGFKHEWVELCPEVTVDVAAISMVHLDTIAQKDGFSPIAILCLATPRRPG